MSKAKAIEDLFRAFGAVQPERAAIYVQDLTEHSARWTDTEVRAGCTRARQRWKHASLPPVGAIIAACHEIREEDQKHRRSQEQRGEREGQRPTEAQMAVEREHLNLASELWDAGFLFCHVSQRWVPADDARELPPELAKPVQIHLTREAALRLRRGELGTGSAGLIAMRAGQRTWAASKPKPRKPRGRSTGHGMTALDDVLKDVTPEQAAVFE